MDIIFNGLFMGDTVKTTVRWVSLSKPRNSFLGTSSLSMKIS